MSSSLHHHSTHAASAHTVAHSRAPLALPALLPRTLLLGLLFVLLPAACVLVAAACSTWGAGHQADAALELDLQDPDRGILTPLERDLEPNERFWIRLELGAPTEADHIIVRFELDVGGRSYQEVEDYRFNDVIPPWNVAAIPLSIAFTGDWNIAFIVNSRKVSDVRVRVEHDARPATAQTKSSVE